MSEVPFVDLRRLQAPLRPQLEAALARVLDHGVFVLGPEVRTFEGQLSEALGAADSVGVSCGTDALLATFMALGLPEGGEVLMTPLSFVASASSVLRAGLRPVFVDVPEHGFHPTLAAFEEAWGPRTVGVLAVHLFGEPVALSGVAQLCADRGGVLVEDCAPAIGARVQAKMIRSAPPRRLYRQPRRIGPLDQPERQLMIRDDPAQRLAPGKGHLGVP